jgi:hypothetical protein
MRLVMAITLALAMRSVRAHAQTPATSSTEVSVGYAFGDVDALAHQMATMTEHGWDASLLQRLTPWLSVTEEIAGTYGASIATGLVVGPPALKGTMHPSTYMIMAGPRVGWRRHRFEPFVQGLVGVARERVGLSGIDFVSAQIDTGVAAGLGAGLDVQQSPRLAVRLIYVEWDRLSLFQQAQRRVGVSAGLILRFRTDR